MRISLVPYGSRGDFQPFLALAAELARRGHDVACLASHDFEPFVTALGIRAAVVDADAGAYLRSPDAQRMLAAGDQASFFAWMAAIEEGFEASLHERLAELASGAELLVVHALQVDRAAVLAAERRIPLVPVYTFPMHPTGELPNPMVTGRRMPFGWMNRLTHAMFWRTLWRSQSGAVARLARSRGRAVPARSFVHEVARRRLPTLTIHSPTLVPRPADWADHHFVTGHFRGAGVRDALGEARPPEVLEAFLAAGDPPIYLGFGSMPFPDGATPLRWAEEVARALERRVVVIAGFTELPRTGQVSERVCAVRSVDHDWLLPRCCAAVHHGGAGTVHASIGAGLPTVVVSVFADQPFWGGTLRRLGAGAHVPFRRASGARLAAVLGALLDGAAPERARSLAEAMRAEDGVGFAAGWLHERGAAVPPPD